MDITLVMIHRKQDDSYTAGIVNVTACTPHAMTSILGYDIDRLNTDYARNH